MFETSVSPRLVPASAECSGQSVQKRSIPKLWTFTIHDTDPYLHMFGKCLKQISFKHKNVFRLKHLQSWTASVILFGDQAFCRRSSLCQQLLNCCYWRIAQNVAYVLPFGHSAIDSASGSYFLSRLVYRWRLWVCYLVCQYVMKLYSTISFGGFQNLFKYPVDLNLNLNVEFDARPLWLKIPSKNAETWTLFLNILSTYYFFGWANEPSKVSYLTFLEISKIGITSVFGDCVSLLCLKLWTWTMKDLWGLLCDEPIVNCKFVVTKQAST